MDAKKVSIFISYSHLDNKWFKTEKELFDLIPFLERSLLQKNVRFWYDRHKETGIEAGDKFKDSIDDEIDKADIALLLISQEFLNSKFITETELPRIQERYEKGFVQVFPILLEPCDWEEIKFISSLQLVPGKPTPLIEFTDNERNWAKTRHEILTSLKKRIEKISNKEIIPEILVTNNEVPDLKTDITKRDESVDLKDQRYLKSSIIDGKIQNSVIEKVSSTLPKDEMHKHKTVGLTPETYAPLIGLLIRDLTDEETILTEYNIFNNSLPSGKSGIFITRGGGNKEVRWDLIESIILESQDTATVNLLDGKTLEHTKLCSYRMIGKDSDGFSFTFDFGKLKSITPLRDTSVPELMALVRDIPILVKQTLPISAYSYIFKLESDPEGILVNFDSFRENKLAQNGHQTFRLPGSHKFTANDGTVSLSIMSIGPFNLCYYDKEVAFTLAKALNRLNTLLSLEKQSSETGVGKGFLIKISKDNLMIDPGKYTLPSGIATIINEKDGTILALIPEGNFWAGSRKEGEGGRPFQVNLPAFYMSIFTVTNRQYAQFLNEVNPGQKDLDKWIILDSQQSIRLQGAGFESCEGKEDHPVVEVSWVGANAYCEWAGLRLPTELEWEKGARGPDGRIFPWGNQFEGQRCRWSGTSKHPETTCNVYDYPDGISPYGLYQMIGNVKQLCADEFDPMAYDNRYRIGDFSIPVGKERVVRGSYYHEGTGDFLTCTHRGSVEPDRVRFRPGIGFRCAKSYYL